jgi:hypothetical protein
MDFCRLTFAFIAALDWAFAKRKMTKQLYTRISLDGELRANPDAIRRKTLLHRRYQSHHVTLDRMEVKSLRDQDSA